MYQFISTLHLLLAVPSASDDVVKIGTMQLCQPIVSAAVIVDDSPTGEPVVSITLAPDAAARFGQMTQRAIGQQLAITLNGDLISSPYINDRIWGREFLIFHQERQILERVAKAALRKC